MKTFAYYLRCFVTSGLLCYFRQTTVVSTVTFLFVNLAEVGEENTHTKPIVSDENDFLKLVVSSRPVISMNFP